MKFIGAVLILSSMIIGVGMFGIPFSFARSGFLLGTIELLVLMGVVLAFHLFYGELVLNSPQNHRLPGYIQIYLGARAAKISWFSAFLGIVGTLISYLALGAVFLNNILGTIIKDSEFFWALVMVACGGFITFFSLKREVFINGIITFLLVFLIIILSFWLLPQIKLANLGGFNLENIFPPYGVLLFALSGGVVIPDLIAFLGRDRKRVRAAIVVGTLLPAVIYFLFALSVIGVVGNQVSPEAISGLARVLGDQRVLIIGSLIGFLAVFTSFLSLSSSFQALLELDLKISSQTTWFLGSVTPLVFYILGFRDFILLIAAVGSLAIGVDSILIVAAYLSLRKKAVGVLSGFSYLWSSLIYFMVAAGVFYEVYILLF